MDYAIDAAQRTVLFWDVMRQRGNQLISRAFGRDCAACAELRGSLRAAADDEDAIEKLPVTPGPIIPAREQLGYLLLEQNRPSDASNEFRNASGNGSRPPGSIAGTRARRVAIEAAVVRLRAEADLPKKPKG